MSLKEPTPPVIARWRRAFTFSCEGLRAAYAREQAFRQEAWASLVLVPLGLYLGDTAAEKALLVASWLLVPIVEILNSAIERVVDRISSEHHALSGEAKDMGSAAVLLALVLSALVWGIILVA